MTAKVETYNLSSQVPHQEEVEWGDDGGWAAALYVTEQRECIFVLRDTAQMFQPWAVWLSVWGQEAVRGRDWAEVHCEQLLGGLHKLDLGNHVLYLLPLQHDCTGAPWPQDCQWTWLPVAGEQGTVQWGCVHHDCQGGDLQPGSSAQVQHPGHGSLRVGGGGGQGPHQEEVMMLEEEQGVSHEEEFGIAVTGAAAFSNWRT